jgi:diacylglycerol kinase (ATP)
VRALLAVNPLSRRGSEGRAVRDGLSRVGVEVVDEGPAMGAIDAIVVGGGDGSVARRVPLALALGVPIGVVPLGTFNDLARTLGIPFDVKAACGVIASGHAATVDVARVNGVYFLTEASIGISSRLARLHRPRRGERGGLWTTARRALQILVKARPFYAEVAYQGRRTRLRTMQLTIANSQRIGGFIKVAGAAIDDGFLDLYSVDVESAADFLSVARAMLSGRPRRHARGLRALRSTFFEVWTRRRHHISADGEPAGTTPARFEILPQAVRFLAPPPG